MDPSYRHRPWSESLKCWLKRSHFPSNSSPRYKFPSTPKVEAEGHVLWLTNENGVPDGGAGARGGSQFIARASFERPATVEETEGTAPHVASSHSVRPPHRLFSCTATPHPKKSRDSHGAPDEFHDQRFSPCTKSDLATNDCFSLSLR